MIYLQKNSIFLLLSLLMFNKLAVSAEPSFIVNIAQYQITGSTHWPFIGVGGESVSTAFLPCTGSREDCLAQTYQNWVQMTGSEGYTVIDDREHSCCATLLYRFYNHEFDYINTFEQRVANPFGTIKDKYNLFMQWSDYDNGVSQIPGIYAENYTAGGRIYSFKIINCPNPKYPNAVDADYDGIAEICYQDVIPPCQIESDERQKDAKDKAGDPISCSSGQSIQKDQIYVDTGADPLSYSLNYITPIHDDAPGTSSCPAIRSNYSQSISKVFDQNDLLVYQVNYGSPRYCNENDVASGYSYIFFSERGGAFKSNASNAKSLELNADGTTIETSQKGQITQYNIDGQLSSKKTKGKLKTYIYTPSGKIKTIRNQYGKELVFSYNSNDLMDSLLTPDGQTYFFEYDAQENMTQVVFPDITPADLSDNPTIQYLYENTDFPRHMTGKINENGNRYASWTFDSKGRATSSINGLDLEKVELDYSVENQTHVTTFVSDTLINEVIHHFEWINGTKQLVEYEQLSCQGCEVGSWLYQYSNNRLIQTTSPVGVINAIEYHSNGLLKQRTEAKGEPQERVTTKSWLKGKLSSQVSNEVRASYGYNNEGTMTSISLQDLVTNEFRSTVYEYSSTPAVLSQITRERLFEEGIPDKTYFTYDQMGNISTIKNGLNHITTFEDYDDNGRVGKVIDANGIITLLTYTPRGWLESSTTHGALTQYEYYPTGSLKQVTTPTGQTIHYEYDSAERLIGIVDSAGNRIDYSRDVMGNITTTNISDANAILRSTQTSVFNALGQLSQSLGNHGQSNTLGYDAEGNPVSDKNALNNTSSNSFDVFNRVSKITAPDLGETRYSYNSQDLITSITDAENNSTLYEYNAFGDLTQLTSPDTGITTFTHDGAGNVITKTDARGITVTYTYDALNRMTSQSYADPAENIIYIYDETNFGNKGIGRLTSISDQSGTTHYLYNAFGQITQQAQEIDGNTYLSEYHYDTNGQLIGMTYPSGQELGYEFDSLGRISSVTTNYLGETQILASQISYLPFGPMIELTYGNGNILTQNYDLDGRLTDKSVSSLAHTNYVYDLTNNITDIESALDTTDNKTYTYDVLSRLLSGTSDLNTIDFSYDSIGNRLTKTDNGLLDDYQYASNSHQLNSVVGTNALSQTFDAVGNTLTRNDLTLSYNQQNRLHTASTSDVNALYLYNFRGERVAKSVNGEVRQFIYNHQGQLIAEADSAGNISSEYIFLNNELLVKIDEVQTEVSKAQEVAIDHEWQTVSFSNSMTNPVLIAGPATYHDSEPGTIQIQNVNGNSADIRFAEWEYLDGVHIDENVSIMALPQGRYTMADGSIWEIGTLSLSDDRVATTHSFSEPFPELPTLILTAQTANDGTPYTIRAKSVTTTGFKALINEEEISKGSAHSTEIVAYVAIYSSAGVGEAEFDGFAFNYGLSSERLRHAWKTLNGYDLKVEEEQSKDSETLHTAENIDILIIDDLLFAQDILTKGSDTSLLRRNTESPQVSGTTESSKEIFYYHNSHLGTPEVLTDSNQMIVWQASYTPFGKADISVEAIENNVRFPGQYFDFETGVYYNYYRYYDPSTGRYITSDPIGLNGGLNTYTYVGGNPLKYIDPTGEAATAAGLCFIPGVGMVSCAAAGAATGVIYCAIYPSQCAKAAADICSAVSNSFNDFFGPYFNEDKPRFIVDSDGEVVDTDITPEGSSYNQPDGGRTDVLQGSDHGAGRTHTHDPNINTAPNGDTFINGLKQPGRPVSPSDIQNIQSGVAKPAPPMRR